MKTTLTNYKDGKILNTEICRTKKEAINKKRSFLSNYTVHQKVKHNIQSILS